MDTLPEITPEAAAAGGAAPPPFRRPADYYASPVQNVRPIFPRWVPIGCGAAAIVLIVVLAGVGAAVSSGAFSSVFELMFAQMQGEIDKMMAPDVKPQQKAAFDGEMKTMRDRVRTGGIKIDRLQPLMRVMRDVVTDERVTSAEVDRLTREVHAINVSP